MKKFLSNYLKNIAYITSRGDAREETYYPELKSLLEQFPIGDDKTVYVTLLPKPTEAGAPDFRVWDGEHHIVGYIEAKPPGTNLDRIETTEQLSRYRHTFPNLILTDFYEFRLYRNGELFDRVSVGRPFIAQNIKTIPPVEHAKEFEDLLDKFFAFSLPRVFKAEELAVELAKRTRFLRDQVIIEELKEETKGKGDIYGFYNAFKKYLITGLTEKQFADLYSQTITYGLFAARTRSDGKFNRKLAFDSIPHTIGILRDVFQFISLGDLPRQMEVIVDDIAAVLHAADINQILRQYYKEGKGEDPILHFYETFLAEYDPKTRERRGVYYTPEPVVHYIVRSIHHLLKSSFNLEDGLASPEVTLLDPAGGTLTFPAEAIRLAVAEYTQKYGEGGKASLIRNQILKQYYAFELMMAPYAIGHLKISFLLDEMGCPLRKEDRFQLYLTNTLELEDITQIDIPGLSSLSEESRLAGRVKKQEPILVILGNPPYSGISANQNKWTEKLLKEDIDGAQSYYTVDSQPLGEKNPKWLQDDYVKFLRFAQWKIHKAGQGVVGMITNHGYLDNPTFRGMRQSLMKTFNEIYILNLHGNSLKRETAPDGGPDENVFDIRQGVAIALFIKRKGKQGCRVIHADLYGRRSEKYNWLDSHDIRNVKYEEIQPKTPYYFFIPRATSNIQHYLGWPQINEIFPVNSVGVVTSRDSFVIDFDKWELENRIEQFRNIDGLPDTLLKEAYHLKEKKNWQLQKARKHVKATSNWREQIHPILYRPFDIRYIFYNDAVIERSRRDVMHHMLSGKNLALIVPRRMEFIGNWQHAFIANEIVEHVVVSLKTIDYIFPLYLYPDTETPDMFTPEKKPNITPKIIEQLNAVYARPHPRSPSPTTGRGQRGGVWKTPPALWEKLKPLAREMRKNPTPAEDKLWQRLRRHQLGVKFRRQHAVGRFIVDFYCSEAQLVIEVDGPIHQYTRKEDAVRQEFLENQGLQVIRFTNQEVLNQTEEVIAQIHNVLSNPSTQTPRLPKGRVTPEEILAYIYAVFYSNKYRQKYAEFLRIDFPRVPFTAEYNLFRKMAALGEQLIALHLLKSDLLNMPGVKYQGDDTNNRIEKPRYIANENRVYINNKKYFEGITPKMWEYQIGGYKVLQKYLKDRKGRIMDDPRRYIRIAAAIRETIALQDEIDNLYSDVEANVINF